MAQLTVGITLQYDKTGKSTSYETMPDVISIPVLQGEPSTHDVTNLSNTQKVYIPGLTDNGGTLPFGVNMTPGIYAAYKAIKTAQQSNKINWKVVFPAPFNQMCKFDGEVVNLTNDEVTPDNPLTGKLNIVANTEVTWDDVA